MLPLATGAAVIWVAAVNGQQRSRLLIEDTLPIAMLKVDSGTAKSCKINNTWKFAMQIPAFGWGSSPASVIVGRPFVRLAIIAGVTFAVVAVSMASPLSVSLAIAPIIAFLYSLVLPIMHEASHKAFGSDSKSMAVGNIAGAVLLIAYPVYRDIHLSHHADPGGPGDKELPVVIQSRAGYVLNLTPWYFLIPFWIETISHVLDRGEIGRATRWFVLPFAVGIAAATAISPSSLIAAYWLPLFMSSFFLFVTTAHEHYAGPDNEWRTRNLRCGPVLQWFLWDTNLHALHHEESDICSGRPSLQRDITDDVGLVEFHLGVWRGLAR